MIGVLANSGAILVGGLLGVLLRKHIPEKIGEAIMIGMGLFVIYLGLQGALKGENPLIAIISIALGAAIGTAIDIDKRLHKLGEIIEKRFAPNGETTVARGFVTASLLFCVGSMAVVGSLQSGLNGDNTMLFTKALMDMILAVMLGASLGIGVTLSAGAILIYEGIIALLAGLVAPLLDTVAITEMTCVGSLLIIALGLNMVKATNIKTSNYIPAIFIAPILCIFM